ncbi:MAG: hypothetical protein JWN45_3035 [Acidobacteriaceae bacterium]|nr:hypothetical protein [Acidobacteriaceae bacterium]
MKTYFWQGGIHIEGETNDESAALRSVFDSLRPATAQDKQATVKTHGSTPSGRQQLTELCVTN